MEKILLKNNKKVLTNNQGGDIINTTNKTGKVVITYEK